jgi:hypothetical protein
MFANASSVSSTVTASNASAAARPAAATAAGTSTGSLSPRARTRNAPSTNIQVPATKYPSPAPKKALRRSREKRV